MCLPNCWGARLTGSSHIHAVCDANSFAHPFVVWGRLWTIPKGTFGMQFARGVLLAIATACFFAALQHLPLAEAITIYFVQPLLLTAISALFLGETIRLRRIMAIAIGLIGVIVILQPSLILFGWPALLPLITALAMACCGTHAPLGRARPSLSNANDGWLFCHRYTWICLANWAGI